MIKAALSAVNRMFAAWEQTGLAPQLRERTEVGLLRATATAFSAWRVRRARADARAGYPKLRRTFEEETGSTLDLENPRSFQEKLQWRKIHDHNPLFPVIADKARVKDWVREQLGEEEMTVPTLFEVTSPLDLPKDVVTRDLVLKVNHASQRIVFVGPKSGRTRGDLIRTLTSHLYLEFGATQHEWHYADIPRKIIAEPLMLKSDGSVPDDLRFFVFGGKLRFIQFNEALFDPSRPRQLGARSHILGPDWSSLNVARAEHDETVARPRQPEALERMVSAAEKLGAPFDFMRVDFFWIDEDVRVAELTVFPASGFARFDPPSFDLELGRHWPIPGHAVLRTG